MNNIPIESTQEGKPAWLDLFLSRTFFGPCSDHKLSKNDLNNYCINCELPLCKNCITSGSHAEHNLLKIYRHVYTSAVPLTDIEKHIDCSRIQPYKCNKKLVVSLKPLPHNSSGSQANNREAACEICKRFLHDPTLYRYCCISCKVEAFATKMTSSEPPFLAIATTLVPNENEEGCPATERGGKARACKRKWTPNKAPLF